MRMFVAQHEIAPIAVNGGPPGREFGPYIIATLDIAGVIAEIDGAVLKRGVHGESSGALTFASF